MAFLDHIRDWPLLGEFFLREVSILCRYECQADEKAHSEIAGRPILMVIMRHSAQCAAESIGAGSPAINQRKLRKAPEEGVGTAAWQKPHDLHHHLKEQAKK